MLCELYFSKGVKIKQIKITVYAVTDNTAISPETSCHHFLGVSTVLGPFLQHSHHALALQLCLPHTLLCLCPGPSEWCQHCHESFRTPPSLIFPTANSSTNLVHISSQVFLEYNCLVPLHHFTPQASNVAWMAPTASSMASQPPALSSFNPPYSGQSLLFKSQPAGNSPLTNSLQDVVSSFTSFCPLHFENPCPKGPCQPLLAPAAFQPAGRGK